MSDDYDRADLHHGALNEEREETENMRAQRNALLAVVKAMPPTIHDKDFSTDTCTICSEEGRHAEDCALDALDAAHPGWREWSA